MPTLEPAGADRQSFAAWRAPGYLQSVSRQEAVDWRGVGLLVVLGRGRDGFVKHVLAQRPHVRRVLLVDPSPDAGRGLPKTDRLAVVTDPTGRDLGAKLHVLLREVSWLRYLRTMQVSPASSTVSPPWASAAVAGLKAAAVASLRYYGNDPGDALLGLRHIVANLAQIARARDFGPLRGALEGRTAVVASAGPSLDDALDRLAVAQDELAIVAPDTSLKPLLAKGIRPHVVTCKERTERTIPLLDGVDTEGIILVALPVVPPEALAGWGGPTVAVYSGGAHFPWLGAVGLPRSILRFDGPGTWRFGCARSLAPPGSSSSDRTSALAPAVAPTYGARPTPRARRSTRRCSAYRCRGSRGGRCGRLPRGSSSSRCTRWTFSATPASA